MTKSATRRYAQFMPYADKEKARLSQRDRSRRYHERQKIKKYGLEAAGKDMRGRHGNQARGAKNGRWNNGTLFSSHGYVLVRVPKGTPKSFGPAGLTYAYRYEHDLVMEAAIGRALSDNETVHHGKGGRSDNRIENLTLKTRSNHARDHANHPGARDGLGRFKAGAKRG